jgi:hypothetical protein
MRQRRQREFSFGSTLAIVAILAAIGYQLFTKVLPTDLAVDPVASSPGYDRADIDDALKLFRR